MSVEKSTAEVYEVRRHGEHATMALRAWAKPVPHSTRVQHGGEVLINSSFGSFCYTWSSVAVPFKRFLLDIGYESFMRKMLGFSFTVYCMDATTELFMAHLTRKVQEGVITDVQAALVMSEYVIEMPNANLPFTPAGYVETIDTLGECTEVVKALTQEQIDEVLGAARVLQGKKPNPQAVGFWEQLWPDLVAALRKELEDAAKAESGAEQSARIAHENILREDFGIAN